MNVVKAMSGWIAAAAIAAAMAVVRSPRDGSDAVCSEEPRRVQAVPTSTKPARPADPVAKDAAKQAEPQVQKPTRMADKRLQGLDLKNNIVGVIVDVLKDDTYRLLLPYVKDEGEDWELRRNAYYSICCSLASMEDRDRAFDLALDFAKEVDVGFGPFKDAINLKRALMKKFAPNEDNPTDDQCESALRKFAELAKSDSRAIAKLAGECYKDIAGIEPSENPEELESVISDINAVSEDAAARFPGDDVRRRKFVRKANGLAREARWRYGYTEKASLWLNQELEWMAADVDGDEGPSQPGR